MIDTVSEWKMKYLEYLDQSPTGTYRSRWWTSSELQLAICLVPCTRRMEKRCRTLVSCFRCPRKSEAVHVTLASQKERRPRGLTLRLSVPQEWWQERSYIVMSGHVARNWNRKYLEKTEQMIWSPTRAFGIMKPTQTPPKPSNAP